MFRRHVRVVFALLCLSLRQGYTGEPGNGHPGQWLDHYTSDFHSGPTDSHTTAPYRESLTNPLLGRHDDGPQRCGIESARQGVYPVGFRIEEAVGITFSLLLESDQLSESLCLQRCCVLGPQECQYIWFYLNQCIAVACSPGHSYFCQYELVPPHILSSSAKYASIWYRDGGNEWPNSEPSHTPPNTPSPPHTEGTMSQLHHTNRPLAVGISPADVVTQDSEIVLSAQLTDQQIHEGAVEYSWKLLSTEPPENKDQVFMSVPLGSEVHLSALSPGVYTVQLTARHIASGAIGSATTTVTIIPAPSGPPLVVNMPNNSPPVNTTLPQISATKTARPHLPTTDKPTENHSQPQPTTTDKTVPQTAIQSSLVPPPTPAAVVQSISDSSSSDGGYSLYVVVGVPVLSIVLLILTASGCIVTATSFILFQEDKKRYRYRKLIYTDT